MSVEAGPWGGLAEDVHCTNDLAFALPERRWVDRTVHTLEVPTDGERACTLLVNRTRLEPGDELESLVSGALQRAGREKPEHAVLRRSQRTVAGRPGIDVAARWRGVQSMFYVRQLHLTAAGLWLIFGVSGSLEVAGACDHHLERLIATLRLRG